MIQNPDNMRWDAANSWLWFEIDEAGEPVRCCIDAQCLYLAFGAKTLAEADATNAYVSGRGWIHAAAHNKAGRGKFTPGPGADVFVHLSAGDF